MTNQTELEQEFTINVSKDQIICREGDLSRELYKICSGKLMICATKDSMVTPLAYLGPNDYFGEFSFFDNQARSADVIAVEDSVLVKIPQAQLKKQFPFWLIHTSKDITKKLRLLNEVIGSKGIRKKNTESIQPLSIEEQTHYFKILSQN